MRIQGGWEAVVLGWICIAWDTLELITMMFNDKWRALHDLIAGTVVVEESGETLLLTAGSH